MWVSVLQSSETAVVKHAAVLDGVDAGSSSRLLEELMAPMGCWINDTVVKSTKPPTGWQGLKRWGLNVLLGRGAGPTSQRAALALHSFSTSCDSLPPWERWDRDPVSPMDDTTKDAAQIHVGYMWVKRRLIVPKMPSGTQVPPPYEPSVPRKLACQAPSRESSSLRAQTLVGKSSTV